MNREVERGTIKKPFERAYYRVAVKLLFDPKKKRKVHYMALFQALKMILLGQNLGNPYRMLHY